MNRFGSKIVLLLTVIFTQSSLGTNAVLLSGQSLGQNGYVKFNNGFMIQWGYNGGSTTHTLTVYMPVSFYDSTYNVYGNIIKDSSDNNLYTFCPLPNTSVSSFRVDRTFYANGSTGNSTAKFRWYAIGRWK